MKLLKTIPLDSIVMPLESLLRAFPEFIMIISQDMLKVYLKVK